MTNTKSKKSARAKRIAAALFGLACIGSAFALWPTSGAAIKAPSTHFSLAQGTRASGLENLAHGGEAVITGSVTSKSDGSIIDAARHTIGAGAKREVRPGGLYEIDRAGLRVSEYDEKTHAVHLVASGVDAPACRDANLASPCLVPRTKDLAFERLLTTEEFEKTLSGSLEADLPDAPVAEISAPSHALTYAGCALGVSLVAWAFASARREKSQSLIAQIQAAAKIARASTKDDVTLAELAKKITALEERANTLEKTRQTLAARIATIDRTSLDRRKREASNDVVDVVDREIAEANKLDADERAAIAGLERILAALNVIPLSTRKDRGVRVKADGEDPVDLALSEIDMRDEAEEEASRVIAKT